MKGSGQTLVGDLFTGMKTGYTNNSTYLTGQLGIVTQIKNAFNMDLSSYGKSAVATWVAGAKTAEFPVPHISRKKNNMGITVGGQRVEVPQFEVKWYRRGGLFTGGNGQIIGVAENNRDEAVLPLEDRKAMSRIANAIIGGAETEGMAINPTAIASAVAQGVSVAMSRNNTTGNQQPIVVELKCDSVTIARAAAKGQQILDQRYHPVAQNA